jgi:hypothetical protein
MKKGVPVAIDGTHIECRDRYIPDQEEVTEEPSKSKKRGRKIKTLLGMVTKGIFYWH